MLKSICQGLLLETDSKIQAEMSCILIFGLSDQVKHKPCLQLLKRVRGLQITILNVKVLCYVLNTCAAKLQFLHLHMPRQKAGFSDDDPHMT